MLGTDGIQSKPNKDPGVALTTLGVTKPSEEA
jgi:hypothetical protein